jgi:dihydrofolate reductase
MRPLRYSINVTLDGCVDHRAADPAEDLHMHATDTIARPDALIFGRVTYELMEFWRDPGEVPDWMIPFAETISSARKYLVSSTREADGWNTELIRSDVVAAVRELKEQPGGHLLVGGVQVPLALANAGLIDEFEFVVHPKIAGHGPTLFSGLKRSLDLQLTGTTEFSGGVVARTYVPAGSS